MKFHWFVGYIVVVVEFVFAFHSLLFSELCVLCTCNVNIVWVSMSAIAIDILSQTSKLITHIQIRIYATSQYYGKQQKMEKIGT